MTDKQIMINGVDVSECEHYEDLSCFAYRDSCGYPLDCKDNDNCYYKQLQREKQKTAQDAIRKLCAEKSALYNELDQLKAENETYKKMLDDPEVRFALIEVKTGERNLWFNKAKKLEQTLTEIKEIADKDFRHTAWEEYAKQLKQILQKISECEVDE